MTGSSQNIGRLQWIENAKGLGVFSVILVHSIIPDINFITVHLSSFTIPLFFVLAGLTYNNERHRGDIRSLIKARGRQYLIPYFVLYTTLICLLIILGAYVIAEVTSDQLVFSLLYGSGPPGASLHLWFLPVLFFGLSLFAITDRIMQDLRPQLRWLIAVLFSFIASVVQSVFSPTLVPWHANAILVAASFMIIGNEMRRIRGLENWSFGSAARDCIGLVIFSTLLIVISTINGFTDIAVDNTGGSIWLYLATGILGAISVFILAGMISQNLPSVERLLIRIGRYSQEVYEVHPMMFYLIPIGLTLVGEITLVYVPVYVIWSARFIVGAFVSLLVVERIISRNSIMRLIFRGSSSTRT